MPQVSCFDGEDLQDWQSISSIRKDYADFASPGPGTGSFQPPEINDRRRLDPRRADAWSYACILADVLAFALGRKNGVLEFRQRREDRDDRFYFEDPSQRMLSQDGILEHAQLKPGVSNWLSEQKQAQSCLDWVARYIDILNSLLRPDPSEREDMAFVARSLCTLSHRTYFRSLTAMASMTC